MLFKQKNFAGHFWCVSGNRCAQFCVARTCIISQPSYGRAPYMKPSHVRSRKLILEIIRKHTSRRDRKVSFRPQLTQFLSNLTGVTVSRNSWYGRSTAEQDAKGGLCRRQGRPSGIFSCPHCNFDQVARRKHAGQEKKNKIKKMFRRIASLPAFLIQDDDRCM